MRTSAAPRPFRADPRARAFAADVPPDRKFKIEDLMAFKRGRGDLVFSALALMVALFFLMTFFTETGWDKRKLPGDGWTYWARQFGLIDGEGRLARLGRILKQGWVAPMICLAILVPAAVLNLRDSWRVHRWRVRFRQPTSLRYEGEMWLRALEFVGWFIAYTLLVPVLGYLVSTLLLGTLLPWRLDYRGPRWMGICLAASFTIVLVFRTGLQIRTPVNIWLYDQLPQQAAAFMKTWF
ncbi:hypothetical protein ATO11_05830 [Pseudaestuariivita atlantica]|uniref:Tripartite tricarboxylate transporter TctB family protein n=2 Tax=Pseudaestuariivita atlantica TaxID=1317121 RepID=A0A0L1JTG6_9RHOB|nr:hypothetical protein ATO11_05830 [Pseudaestuariivita atlantica]